MAFYDRKGTDPARIEVRMEKERAFEEFPGLTGEELEAVNDLYQHYLFYERVPGGRRFWTSCCHETGRVLRPAEERTAAGTVWPALSLHHGAEVRCPFCGRAAQLKAKGTARRCSGLEEYIPVVFLSAADGGETVYAQAYWTVKDYRDNWAAEPLYRPTYVYRFRRGEAVQWENGYDGIWLRQVNGFFKEPFRSGGGLFIHYDDYRAAGLECLKASFLRYIDVEGCRSRSGLGGWWNLMRTLALAAQYPENVEMLQKAGMTEVLDDWTRREKKNAAAIRWGETDPRRAFGLNGQELKEFLSTGRRIGTVALYKQLRRRNEKITVKETAAMVEELGDRAQELVKLCRAWDLPVKRALRYLGGGAGDLRYELQAWKDYLCRQARCLPDEKRWHPSRNLLKPEYVDVMLGTEEVRAYNRHKKRGMPALKIGGDGRVLIPARCTLLEDGGYIPAVGTHYVRFLLPSILPSQRQRGGGGAR